MMSAKRTLEELILIYEIEPSLVDLFCEGPSDASILRFFIEGMEKRTTAVYSADQIEWPATFGSHGGHRSRIISLSRELSSKRLNGICVIDKDLDSVVDRTPGNANLLKSDFANINMYGLDVDDIRTFIYTKFNLAVSYDQLLKVFEACRHLFAIRFLREDHCTGSTLASAEEILDDPKAIVFSADTYLARCRQLNGYEVRWDNVISALSELLESMTGEFRDYINVHDLGAIMAATIRSLKSRTVHVSADFIAKHCAYVLLSQRQFGYPLFSEISTRLIG